METIDKALAFLWENSRFASYFYQTVRFSKTQHLATWTLSVSERRAVLSYNPEFVESLSVDELVGLLVHEMLHVVFNHRHRVFQDKNPYLQNLAQDMVINSYIHDRRDRFFSQKTETRNHRPRLVLPKGLPAIPRDFFDETGVSDPSWETVYRWLKKRGPRELEAFSQGLKTLFSKNHAASPSKNSNGAPPLLEAVFEPDHENGLNDRDLFVFETPGQKPLPTGAHSLFRDDAQQVLSINLLKAVSLSDRDETALTDRLFSEISTMIKAPRSVVMDPVIRKVKTVIHRFSQSRDFQMVSNRFNRRFFANGVYSPGRSYVNLKTITVAVDVSASMVTRPETLEKAFGVVEALIKTYRVSLVCLDESLFIPVRHEGRFVNTDTENRGYLYKKGDWRYLRSGSSGTTFFVPLFNRYMSGRKDMLIVITDGQIYDLDILTPYERTLWLVPQSLPREFHPPFGTVVYLEEAP